jgi:hypothetical protein
MPYDLFISYSRKDNLTNRVTKLKSQIKTDYLGSSKEPLNCLFGQEEIKGMDDWQLSIQPNASHRYSIQRRYLASTQALPFLFFLLPTPRYF